MERDLGNIDTKNLLVTSIVELAKLLLLQRTEIIFSIILISKKNTKNSIIAKEKINQQNKYKNFIKNLYEIYFGHKKHMNIIGNKTDINNPPIVEVIKPLRKKRPNNAFITIVIKDHKENQIKYLNGVFLYNITILLIKGTGFIEKIKTMEKIVTGTYKGKNTDFVPM